VRDVAVVIDVQPFPDEAYVEGPDGANFDTRWITRTANHWIRSNTGLLLVHAHGGSGRPVFSSTDRRTNRAVMARLGVGILTAPYGALLLSDNDAAAVLAISSRILDGVVQVVPDGLGEMNLTA
jgi:hypothetical protein